MPPIVRRKSKTKRRRAYKKALRLNISAVDKFR